MSSRAHLDKCHIVLGEVEEIDAFGLELWLDGEAALVTVSAPGPGLFRTRRQTSDPPLLPHGQYAPKKSLIGFLQRGVLLLPFLMPQDGWLLASARDGERVEHGSPLFRFLRRTDAVIP